MKSIEEKECILAARCVFKIPSLEKTRTVTLVMEFSTRTSKPLKILLFICSLCFAVEQDYSTSRSDGTKHIGKRLTVFPVETSFLVESYKSEAKHNHLNMPSRRDSHTKRVTEITVEKFGQKGTAVGQFGDAKDVTYVSYGRTLVTDLVNSRVQMCSNSGRTLMVYKGKEIAEPWATALTKDGHIAVTSCRNKCVQIINEAGDILDVFGDGIFERPAGIAIDKKGRYIVTDIVTNRVSIHNQKGEFLNYLGNASNTLESFNSPRYVCCSENGDVIVSDSGSHCFKIFDARGKLFKTVGSFGKGKNQFKYPLGICTSSQGDIFVADHYNSRVSMFDCEGVFINHLMTSSKGLKHPQGIAISPELNLYVTHGYSKAIEILTLQLQTTEPYETSKGF